MNAYELAEIMEIHDGSLVWEHGLDIANMLRQQADRIAELEKSAEPVAWMEYIQGEEWEVWYVEPKDLPEGHTYKPLYTTPQIKELSDKEITQVFDECYPNNCDGDVVTLIDFARAILKKASEK